MPNTIAATVSKRISLGGTDYLYMGRLTPDTSYATGGDEITKPTGVGVVTLPEKFDYFGIEASAGGHVAVYNRTGANAGKVQLYEGAAGPLKEVAAATNLSTTDTFDFVAIGA
jgi:hypothetical protein